MTFSCELCRSCTNVASRFAVTVISILLQVMYRLGAGGQQIYDGAVYLGIYSFASLREALERAVRIGILFSGISVRRRTSPSFFKAGYSRSGRSLNVILLANWRVERL